MIEQFFWIISLFTLFLGVFWIQVFLARESNNRKPIKNFPKVSVIVPAKNEEKTLAKTINSLLKINYPKDKLQIIIVNDGSTDNTEKVAKSLINKNPSFEMLLVNRRANGSSRKAAALNFGLKFVNGEFVACLDSDTYVSQNSLKRMLAHFEDRNVGSVISGIRVINPDNIYGKIQRLEYIFTTFIRSLMSKIGTLHITPGALSLYRTEVLKKMGGFDENSLTEDFEIAMKLRYNHYLIKMEPRSITYTSVPDSFGSFWNQRVRWFRGFIETSMKYKHMLGNKNYGILGIFQYPVNILSFLIILTAFSFLSYEFFQRIYRFFIKLFMLKFGYLDLVKIPDLKEVILTMNIKLIFPIIISFIFGFYIYLLAHKFSNEKLKYPFSIVVFFTVYPILRSLHWVTATYKEIKKSEKNW